MIQQTKPKSAARIAISAIAGSAACALLATIALAAGNDSFARGIVSGGAIGIGAVSALVIAARRKGAPAEARLVAGQADERERHLAMRAGAFAAIAMYAAAVVVAMLTAVVEFEAQAGLAIIMFTGLFTVLGVFIVSVRKG